MPHLRCLLIPILLPVPAGLRGARDNESDVVRRVIGNTPGETY